VVEKLNHKEHKEFTKDHKGKKNKIMYNNYQNHLNKIIEEIKEAGLYKKERIIWFPLRELKLNLIPDKKSLISAQ